MNERILLRERVRARRRTAGRLGLLGIVALTATACIFEKSDYKGGGRLDKGATVTTAEPTATDDAGSTPADASTE